MFDVLLVDDHKIMRDGLKAILRASEGFRVVAEAADGPSGIHLARQLRPQLVVMDLSLPGLGGIEATMEILRHVPECRIVVLSMYDDENSVIQSIRAGARGFVLKTASDADLLDALRTVARGGSYMSSQVSDKLLRRIQLGDLETLRPSGLEALTPREVQIMRMIADGKSSKDIAVVLDLSLQTVRSYRKTLMKKLRVSNVAELTQVALAVGVSHSPVLAARTVSAA
jgi:DNA-binding NarL/FixJ family response regulator